MDPDRWEFANEWFLRGQKHLLRNIVRRKHSGRINCASLFPGKREDQLEDEALAMEIRRLKEEQKSLDEELQGMNRRLEATEKRPQQMMAFLCKVAEDPDVLSRILQDRKRKQIGEKKRRLISSTATAMATTSSSSSSGMAVKREFEEEEATVGAIISSSSPETSTGFEIGRFCQDGTTSGWWSQQRNAITGRPRLTQQAYHYNAVSSPLTAVAGNNAAMSARVGVGGSYSGCEDNKGKISFVTEMAAESSARPPYPFSLLEGGF